MYLRFFITLTLGTGSGALAAAMQRIVEMVLLTTDRDGIIVQAPGRALYQRATDLLGTPPAIVTAFAAASATYDIQIPIHFCDPLARRPEDTILNTARYNSVRLSILMGGVNRLLSTVGTSTVTGTLSIEIERQAGPLEDTMLPIASPFLQSKSSVDPNSVTVIELERATDLSYKRIALFCSDVSASWQGTADNAVLNLVSIEDQDGFAGWRQRQDDMIQHGNQEMYGLETLQAGRMVMDYMGAAGSIGSAEASGGKSRFQVTYTTDTPTSRYVHSFIDGVRTLKAAA